MTRKIQSNEMKMFGLVKGVIEGKFSGMTGFHKKTMRFDVGLDTPLLAEVEAVTGFVNKDKPASAVYVTMFGLRQRYNGKRWIAS